MIDDRVVTGGATTSRSPSHLGRPVARTPMVVVALLAATTIGAVMLTFLLLSGGGDGPRLVIHDLERDELVYARPVEVGERFDLEHVHSVTGRRVVETFSVLDATTVAIEELWFDEHGANLPRGPERIGDSMTTYIEEADGYRVVHDSYAIGSLPLLVGSTGVDHVMIFADGERLRLLDVARAGARIEVSLDG